MNCEQYYMRKSIRVNNTQSIHNCRDIVIVSQYFRNNVILNFFDGINTKVTFDFVTDQFISSGGIHK